MSHNLEPQQEKNKSRDGTVIKTRIKLRQENQTKTQMIKI